MTDLDTIREMFTRAKIKYGVGKSGNYDTVEVFSHDGFVVLEFDEAGALDEVRAARH